MITLAPEKKKKKDAKHLFWPVTSALLVTLLLFYIDEGNYNFNGMAKPSNWPALFIYIAGFLIGQFIVYRLLLQAYEGKAKMFITCIVGIPLGFMIALVLMIGAPMLSILS